MTDGVGPVLEVERRRARDHCGDSRGQQRGRPSSIAERTCACSCPGDVSSAATRSSARSAGRFRVARRSRDRDAVVQGRDRDHRRRGHLAVRRTYWHLEALGRSRPTTTSRPRSSSTTRGAASRSRRRSPRGTATTSRASPSRARRLGAVSRSARDHVRERTSSCSARRRASSTASSHPAAAARSRRRGETPLRGCSRRCAIRCTGSR